jgi:general secretion pathway protein D
MPAAPAIPAAPVNPAAPAGSTSSATPGAQNTPAIPSSQAAPAAKAPDARSGTILNITVPPTVRLNERFSVGIAAANVTNLYSAPFVLAYDPAVLDFEVASEGPFLKNDGKPTSFQATKAKDAGQITVNLSMIGNVGGVNGAGMLVYFTFKAKSQGSSNLGFSAVRFSDPGGKPIDVMPFNAIVEVKQPGNIPAGP